MPSSESTKRFLIQLYIFASDSPADRLLIIFPHLGEYAAFFDKFLVRAAFHDFAALHNENLVGVHDACESVRNHQNCFAFRKCLQSLLYKAFVFGVCECGRFVKNDDGGVLENGACEDDSLLLAAKEVCAFAPDDVLMPSGKRSMISRH